MKVFFLPSLIIAAALASCNQPAKSSSPESQTAKNEPPKDTTKKSLFIDVHNLQPGKVNFADVMAAHQKDLATEGKYDVNFIKFWVDEKKGKVYCLSSAKDSQSITQTHAEAHGLLPSAIFKVTDGAQADAVDGKQFFIDVHNLGAGNVTAEAAAGAHSKDLAVEKKYGVNFINYWVDEKAGNIYCLSQAPDSNAIIHTHKEAHGLLPAYVLQVKQGE
jgi:Nickel responsive protein SCO4226-like